MKEEPGKVKIEWWKSF